MFITQAFKGENKWWRYILVTVLVLLGYQIGTLPLIMAIWRVVDEDPDLDRDDVGRFLENPNFDEFGINTNLGLTLMLLMFVAAMAVLYFVIKPIHKREFNTIARTSGPLDWSRIFYGFIFWLLLGLGFESIGYFLSPENYTVGFKLNTFLPLLALSLFILPIQTSFEEFFFRGYLMQGIGITKLRNVLIVIGVAIVAYFIDKALVGSILSNDMDDLTYAYKAFGIKCIVIVLFLVLASILIRLIKSNSSGNTPHNYKIVALFLSSVLFGLVHSANPEIEKFGYEIMMLYYISAGMLLGIVTLMDNRIELALGIHAATNFTGAVFVGYDGAAIQTDSILTSHSLNPYIMTGGFFVLAAVFLFFTKKKYKWGSFTKLLEPIHKPDEDIALGHLLVDSDN